MAQPDDKPTDQALDEQGSSTSDAILPFGERLDEIAQDRFNRTDWIELAAAILLALATIVAAWSAYQATRWGGVHALCEGRLCAAISGYPSGYMVFAFDENALRFVYEFNLFGSATVVFSGW